MFFAILFTHNSYAQAKHIVEVTNNKFTPKTVKINEGDTVVWINKQGFHNVNGNKSKFPNNPESFGNSTGYDWTYSHVFTIPGKYDYVCDPHVSFGMVGVVEVTGDGGNEVVLNCPSDFSISACSTQEAIDKAYEDWLLSATASGGCDVNITNNAPLSAPRVCEGGSITVTFTATPKNNLDTSCETKSCSATFIVEPVDSMIMTCVDDHIEASCQSQGVVDQAYQDWLNTVKVTGGGCNVSLENNAPALAPLVCDGGSVTVTFIAKDSIADGEICATDTCIATFTVQSPEMMKLVCPPDHTEPACKTQAEIDASFENWINMASATGGCNVIVTNDAPASAPLTCDGGMVVVTFTATETNADGTVCKTESCSATFTLEAPEPLNITCPPNLEEMACQNEDSLNSVFQSWVNMATVSGGCNAVLTHDAPDVLPVICDNNSVVVTFTATDTNADGTVCQTLTCSSEFIIRKSGPPTLSINFSNMTPHSGQQLWLSVKESGTGKEISRQGITVSSEFVIQIPNLMTDSSYIVDFFADFNGNGRYDAPPVDHAWRLEINNIQGDTTLNFVHNPTFTDIMWKNKLTVNFTGMNPHVGQNLWFAVIDKDNGEEKIRTNVEVQQEFTIQTYGIEVGKSYYINFFSDHNGSRTYDSPPVDHAWQLELNNVRGDTILYFTHNINFTDINLSTGIEKDLNFEEEISVYPNPATRRIFINTTGENIQDYTYKIYNPAGVQLKTGEEKGFGLPVEVDVSEFKSGLYFIRVETITKSGVLKFIKQ